MQASSAVQVRMEGRRRGRRGHVGLHALGAFADRLGMAQALSAAVPRAGERRQMPLCHLLISPHK